MYQGQNYIDGEWREHRHDFTKINPSTEEDLGAFPQSTSDEINEAIAAAKNALPEWRAKSRVQRAEYFDKLCELLKLRVHDTAMHICNETGKTFNEAQAEVVEALHMAQFTFGMGRNPSGVVIPSELAEREMTTIRKPKGVVGIISPWNFPYAIGGFWCAAPALLEGNTVVFKPSEDTPFVGQLIATLYAHAGFPKGVFNLVHGNGDVGRQIVEHPHVNHICFTGSAAVGKFIRRACAEHHDKSCSCEMGSKSAVIVFEDGDLELAAAACLNSAFKLSGQRCVSAGRILVEWPVYNKFCERFVELAKQINTGYPSDPTSFYGPLINANQRRNVETYNQMVRDDNGKEGIGTHILLDSSRVSTKGFFMSPMVYKAMWGDRRYLKEEVFGPHVAIIPFSGIDEAVKIYNDTNYGLALGCVTSDYRKMREIRDRCEAGLMYFNLGSIGAESHNVFGGVKGSGYGGASAAGTFDAVTHKVAVTVNHGRTINFPQGLK